MASIGTAPPSDTIAILRAYLDDFPTTLSEDTLASGRTFRIRTTSPTSEFIICGHRIAALGNAPTTWEFEHLTRAEIHQPLRIDAHRYGVITHIDNLGDLTPATATSLLVTLAPFLHDAPTLVLSNASTRKVIAYTTKNRRKNRRFFPEISSNMRSAGVVLWHRRQGRLWI
nr:PhzF family phenazine biosynthesis protein [Corynebacterium diphtheriae]